jgi:uncharacterized protein (TIGR04255 family)
MSGKYFFTNPPIVEIVLGVQLSESVFTNEEIVSIYTSYLKDNFPKIEENLPLPSIVEEYNNQTITTILPGFNSRKLFISKNDNEVIQLQSNRILFNWRKINDTALYPRFENVFENLLNYLNLIDKKIKCKHLINQFEITYIDHFQIDLFDLSSFNISEIFNIMHNNENFTNVSVVYTIPQQVINGNLNIKFQSAIRNNDNKKIIVLDTTCRGFNKDSIEVWFNKSHDIIHDYFFNFISEKTKKVLGYKNG